MASNYKLTYNVDIVLCIDCTGSMGDIIERVKMNAINFHIDLMNAMEEKNRRITQLRVRIVAFRDYIADGDKAMMTTRFFKLPEEIEEFEQSVLSLKADGGGDDPEDGLEALAYAIKSDWDTSATKRRQVIVVWTDAPTHNLGFAAKSPYYPKEMPRDLAELHDWWEGTAQRSGYVDNNAKRLIMYAPDLPDWNIISSTWGKTIYFPSKAGEGLEEYEYKEIIDVIANSV